MNTKIFSPTAYETAHYDAVCRLLGQLTTRTVQFTQDMYRELLDSPCSHLFLLQAGDDVVGMLTVGVYHSPTGSKAWIEDVTVDEVFRGRGFGRMLVSHAMDFCREQGVNVLMLTSNPRRVAANALYQAMGFDRKETNMYRLELKK